MKEIGYVELPDETVPQGNAYFIMNMILKLMKHSFEITHAWEFGPNEQEKYLKDATSGDYTHLRKVSQEICNLINNYKPRE